LLAVIPTLHALARPLDELDAAARALAPRLDAALGSGYRVEVEESTSQVGSGALPTEEIPTRVLVVTHDDLSAEAVAARFRRATPPIVGRIRDDRFLLDVRTVPDPADLIPVW
jgi:L-seryl-tRNA(Ser) seleniumtransferase